MSLAKYNNLVGEFLPWIASEPKSPHNRAVPVDKRVTVIFYYLKDCSSIERFFIPCKICCWQSDTRHWL